MTSVGGGRARIHWNSSWGPSAYQLVVGCVWVLTMSRQTRHTAVHISGTATDTRKFKPSLLFFAPVKYFWSEHWCVLHCVCAVTMVTSRARGDKNRKGKPQQRKRKPAAGSKARRQAPPGTRRKRKVNRPEGSGPTKLSLSLRGPVAAQSRDVTHNSIFTLHYLFYTNFTVVPSNCSCWVTVISINYIYFLFLFFNCNLLFKCSKRNLLYILHHTFKF